MLYEDHEPETEPKQSIQMKIFSMVVIVGVCAFVSFIVYDDYKKTRYFQEHGVYTTGVSTRHEEDPRSYRIKRRKFLIVIAYKAHDGHYYETTIKRRVRSQANYQVGDRYTVVYLPDKPEQAIVDPVKNYFILIIIVVGTLMAVFMGFVVAFVPGYNKSPYLTMSDIAVILETLSKKRR